MKLTLSTDHGSKRRMMRRTRRALRVACLRRRPPLGARSKTSAGRDARRFSGCPSVDVG